MNTVAKASASRALVEGYLLLLGVHDPVARHDRASAVLQRHESEVGQDRRGIIDSILAECVRDPVLPAQPAVMFDNPLSFASVVRRLRSRSARLVSKPALALGLILAAALFVYA